MHHTFWRTTLAVALAASAAGMAHAQQLELAAGGGLASYRSGGDTYNKGKFEVDASVVAGRILSVGFEYGYSPISYQAVSAGSSSASQSDYINTYGGVVRVGLVHVLNVQPYVAVSFGGASETAKATYSSGGSTLTQSASNNGGYFGGGGGVNLGFGGGFGVRPEIRYQHFSIAQGGNFNELEVTGSLYYRFGSHHRH